MSARYRPLILWEAPGDDIMADFAKSEAKAGKADAPAKSAPTAKPAQPEKKTPTAPASGDAEETDAPDPGETDEKKAPSAEDDGAGDEAPPEPSPDEMDDDEEDGGGDLAGETSGSSPSDPVADRLRREQLLNEIESIRDQAKSLERSLAFLADRASEASARTMAATSRKIVEEAARQCSVILINFSDLGYDRVLTVFRTVRERVSAVAEIVKHVIDGDDDFRDSRSGATERDNGPPSGRA